MATIAALPVGSSPACARAAKHIRLHSSSSSSSSCAFRNCSAKALQNDELHQQSASFSSGAESNTRGAAPVAEEKGRPLKLSAAVVLPMLAAALVGSGQPAVQASEWDKFLVPVDNNTGIPSGDEAKDLMERIQEKRARGKTAPSEPTEEKSDTGASSYSSPFFSPAPVYSPPPPAPKTVETPAAKTTEIAAQVAKQSPVEIRQKEREVVEQVEVEAATNEKTHGFLPLFLTQFLLLVATVGGGYVLVTTPESKWEEAQQTVGGFVDKATPVVKDSWTKAKPVAIQAQQKAQEVAVKAKPYVIKAWEASKPLAAKAVEISIPILKGAQAKAAQFLQQTKSKGQ